MADETESKSGRNESDDVKQSFAWGQLFAGSLIGGLAVWKLLHKLTNTEPSEWFFGLSRAYEEVRDFLMTPFEWINLGIDPVRKNMLVLALVLAGALARVAVRSPRWAAVLVFVLTIYTAIFTSISLAIGYLRAKPITPELVFSEVIGVGTTMLVVVCVWKPIHDLRSKQSVVPAPINRRLLLNVFFTAVVGTALLLLNWATS